MYEKDHLYSNSGAGRICSLFYCLWNAAFVNLTIIRPQSWPQRHVLPLNFCTTYYMFSTLHQWASLVAQLIKNPPATQETWVWSLGWEHPLDYEKPTHSSILALRISWTICSMGTWNMSELQTVRHAWVTFLSLASLACNLTLFIISLYKFLPPTNTYKHTHAYT